MSTPKAKARTKAAKSRPKTPGLTAAASTRTEEVYTPLKSWTRSSTSSSSREAPYLRTSRAPPPTHRIGASRWPSSKATATSPRTSKTCPSHSATLSVETGQATSGVPKENAHPRPTPASTMSNTTPKLSRMLIGLSTRSRRTSMAAALTALRPSARGAPAPRRATLSRPRCPATQPTHQPRHTRRLLPTRLPQPTHRLQLTRRSPPTHRNRAARAVQGRRGRITRPRLTASRCPRVLTTTRGPQPRQQAAPHRHTQQNRAATRYRLERRSLSPTFPPPKPLRQGSRLMAGTLEAPSRMDATARGQ